METMTKLEREQAQKLIEMDAALDRLWNLNNDLCSQIESGAKTIAQLRDELATVKAELANVKEDTADLIIERDQLKQRAERAEAKLLEVANDARTLAISNVSCRQERDEALAKLGAMQTEFETFRINTETRIKGLELGRDEAVQAMETAQVEARKQQPRMFMRDGQLWEVFDIRDTTSRVIGWQFYSNINRRWDDCTALCVWSSEYIYRRPITASELQGWIEPQPQGEVLFRGELSFELDMLHRLGLGKVPLQTPVHTVITRKAGE